MTEPEIKRCPVCDVPVPAGKSDDYGRCANCAASMHVIVDGKRIEVTAIEMRDGEKRDSATISPKTRERIMRGIRTYLRETGNEIVEPIAVGLSTRQLAAAQGFDPNRLTRAMSRLRCSPGYEVCAACTGTGKDPKHRFCEVCGGNGEVVAEKRQAIPLTQPCNECGVLVSYADWNTHACRPEDRAKYTSQLDERRTAREVRVSNETVFDKETK